MCQVLSCYIPLKTHRVLQGLSLCRGKRWDLKRLSNLITHTLSRLQNSFRNQILSFQSAYVHWTRNAFLTRHFNYLLKNETVWAFQSTNRFALGMRRRRWEASIWEQNLPASWGVQTRQATCNKFSSACNAQPIVHDVAFLTLTVQVLHSNSFFPLDYFCPYVHV